MSTATALTADQAQTTKALDRERRSSSLSDLEERIDNEEIDHMDLVKEDDLEANDTEAETERLEDTPLTQRKHQDVLLTSAAGVGLISSPISPTMIDAPLRAMSEASSLAVSSEEEAHPISNTSSPRKRKRLSFDEGSESLPSSANTGSGGKSRLGSASPSPAPKVSRTLLVDEAQADSANVDEAQRLRPIPRNDSKSRTSTRKSKQNFAEADEVHRGEDNAQDRDKDGVDDDGVLYSNGEDQDGEEAVDADLDHSGRSAEDVLKKRSALDSLTSIEKSFATMRDKLFDERLAATNEELALLQTPGVLHPELLAMKEVVDHHRNLKIEYQQTFLKYKLETLQKESVAKKHQILSQYMQTVRDMRDRSLDQLNKEFYQVQRERRSGDGDIPDYLYLYTNKRSQQITQQTAYNNEVSILSGVAKYVGFPTAPNIQKVRTDEAEEDMRNMGVILMPPQTLPNRLSPAPVQRQAPSAEEHFIERHAWANPNHPAHRQQRLQMHRQTSQLSQASTPVSTPVPKSLPGGVKVQGSASTIPDLPSDQGTSKEPIAIADERPRVGPSLQGKIFEQTPSHKHECKVYTSLHPNVLPNTIRLLLRLLLRYKHSNLPPETWRSFTALESHTTSFKSSKTKNSDNLTTWQTITLMSQAILKYSSLDISPESMQSHLARVMINTHTLTTDTLDPLGLCLEPKTAMLNHSCTPNSYLIFSGPTLSLRSLVDIPKGTELTIAYVDTTNPTLKRQAELQERYFFTCNCHGCSKKLTNNAPDPRLEDPRIQRLWADVTELQSGAASLPPLEAVEKLRSALKILKKEDYLPSQQPFAAVLHSFFLNAVACQDWLRALKCAVNAARQVEPVQYPVEHHPVRVVRKWVLLKLVVQIVGLMLEGRRA
ncbi:uncharacterized protein KY384_004175 [Bacidia gigantensis]|uniref:uncharacterized protein n=1 Tax=Bacidia gigantensis TaxID=2732470 RepID=UPI001D051039|nr:uncharacterized protein KY384_004175 [Bacidia gigantensis]KAG8530818.1 hypothetical protein KY384_004175 [Bacidia gigantensis]